MAVDERLQRNSETYGLNAYQQDAAKTAVYPGRGTDAGLQYVALGLCGEAGEVAEKVKKIMRDDGGVMSEEKRQAIAKESSDVLWYLAELCTQIGYDLGEIGIINIKKLRDRQDRGVLSGSGDDR
jgi:NTP pyrophosphatase (non-canonical NTP hydrolase)